MHFPKVKSINQSINCSPTPNAKNQVSPAALPACQTVLLVFHLVEKEVGEEGGGDGRSMTTMTTLGWVILYSTVLFCTERTVRVFCL
jgi:hypothetical protein